MFGLHIGNLKDILTRNPLKFGDALGLTYGPLSGRAPGKLTSTGLDWQGKLNPGVSRTALDSANQIAPWIAGAIATFGGSTAGQGGVLGGSSGAAAEPAAASSTPAWMRYAKLGQMGMGLLGGGGGQQGQPSGPFGPGTNMSPPVGGSGQNTNPFYGWPTSNPFGPNYGRY